MVQNQNEGPGAIFLKYIKYSDIGVAIVVVGIVMMLIIPLPPSILDLLLILNICSSMITILMAIYIKNPLEFAVFPTALLIATIFRLALDVSATRLILAHGNEPHGAGHVIPAFGQFVVGGNIVIGLIIFIILIIIQFVVITNGAERIAQVAARFTLDAMPGKQMAIDADLHSGLIDAEGAKLRRREIEREADFYGSMDGAGKFVKGDAMAAAIIMIVNIIGGVLVGIFYHKMPAGEAFGTYAILSIGNGLVTTIPAFLMSTSMGMVVSRAASDANLGEDVIKQVTAQPKALKVAAGFMALMGVMGLLRFVGVDWGLPSWPFLVLAFMSYFIAVTLEKQQTVAVVHEEKVKEATRREVKKRPETVISLMQVDVLSIEVGRNLLTLLDPNQGAKLLDRVNAIRKVIAMEMGIVVPGVRFKDNLQLKPNSYVIKIKEVEVAQAEVMVNQYLALGMEEKIEKLRGKKTVDPTYKVPGMWITPDQVREAEKLGCMIFDTVSVIASQLSEVIRNHAYELIGRQDLQALMDTVKRTHPAVVKELLPDNLSLGEILKVLQNLLKEKVSIRDLITVLETLADNVHTTKDVEILTECVRSSLARTICKDYIDNENTISCITLDPQIEQVISQSIQRTERGSFISLDPNIGKDVLTALGKEIAILEEQNLQPIILCAPTIRLAVKRLTERSFHNLIVLSWNEIATGVQVNSLGMVSM
ncbi:MAG: flagellar biosynthesis protein FlhA [Armatimonadota bacterium]